MLSNPQSNLQSLVAKMLIDDKYKEALRYGEEMYMIRQYKIQNLLPHQVFVLHYALASKFYTKASTNNQTWYQNQLRLFIWVLVCYSFQYQRCISKMTHNDWAFFAGIFNNKSLDIFQFQALSILKRDVKFSRWTVQEKKMLEALTKDKSRKNRWNNIAKELFLRSQKKYYRSGKQCREYFINHLDPVTDKRPWRKQEELQLVKAVKNEGKKWARVAKKLNGRRTQHMVKNKYKSLYQYYQKILIGQQNGLFYEEQILQEMINRLKIAVEEQKLKESLGKQVNQQGKVIGMKKFQSAGEFSERLDQEHEDSFYQDSAFQLSILSPHSPKLNCLSKTYHSMTYTPLNLEEIQNQTFKQTSPNNIDLCPFIFQDLNRDFN